MKNKEADTELESRLLEILVHPCRIVLPEGIDRTEESYKREILKLRIENERLKKTMPCGRRMLENWNIFV